MKNKNFKSGDKVKRINRNWHDIKVGEVYEVDYLNGTTLYLKNKSRGYDLQHFTLVDNHNEEVNLSFDL